MLTEVTDMQNTRQCNELAKKKKKKPNQPTCASQMFLGQTHVPMSGPEKEHNSRSLLSPKDNRNSRTESSRALKFFYTSITSNTYFTWNVVEQTMFLTMAKLYNVDLSLSFSVGGFPTRKLC